MPHILRIALAQLSMTTDFNQNLEKSIDYMERAKKTGADLVFFPEIHLSRFFPQFPDRKELAHSLTIDDIVVQKLQSKARELRIYCSPNVYLKENQKYFDASLWIQPNGKITGISKMVHVPQFDCFFEQDYYSPSDTGFEVYSTPWGKIGIVICFDRHFPESIRTCVFKGAELILIPTANILTEDLEFFEWECRVAAKQNGIFIAMCNRVGKEDNMTFAGQSLVVAPTGKILAKASDRETLLIAECDFEWLRSTRKSFSYLKFLRAEWYLSKPEIGFNR